MEVSIGLENQQGTADAVYNTNVDVESVKDVTTTNTVRRLEWLALAALKRVPNPPTYFETYENKMLFYLMPFEPELESIHEDRVRMTFRKIRPGGGDFIFKSKAIPQVLPQPKKKQSKRRFSSLFQRKAKKPTIQPQISSGENEKKEKPSLLRRLMNCICCIKKED